MQRWFCGKCKKDITFYRGDIVCVEVETKKVKYIKSKNKIYYLCSKCWRDMAIRID